MTQTVTSTRSIDRPDGTVTLPDAPPILGLTFRQWRGAADVPIYVEIANAANQADDEPEVVTPEGALVEFSNLSHTDPARDLLIAEVDGAPAAWSRVFWEDDNAGGRAYISYGYVHPAWRRRGLGTAMLRHDERRLRDIAAGHGDVGPTWLASWAADSTVGNTVLMEQEGYRADRRFYLMVRPTLDAIEEVPMPEGIEVRPIAVDDVRRLWNADVEAFRDHWGGVDESEESYRGWRESPLFDPSLFVVAWDGDEIAGGIINGIEPAENATHGYQRGWLHSVFTRRAWRRRGLATALISRSLLLLRERGMTSAQLGVDAKNPHAALAMYRAAGFEVSSSATAWRKEWKPG